MAGTSATTATREFSQRCYEASRALRRLPAEVKKTVKSEVRSEVADPLAAKIGAAAVGPYAAALSASVKTSADTVPRIKIGGARKVVSGGASAADLVFGTEFGGGNRVSTVQRSGANRKQRGRRGRPAAPAGARSTYRRRVTRQFVPARPFIFTTVTRESPSMLASFATIVDRVLDGWRDG